MIAWQFAVFKYAHFHGGRIKLNKLSLGFLHLLDMCLHSKLYYILVFFNQLYLIVCKHGRSKHAICGSSSLKTVSQLFQNKQAHLYFQKASYSWINAEYFDQVCSFDCGQRVISTRRTQECGLDIQEPSEQTLISTVQIRQWSWVGPFHKLTHVYKYNATVSELCLFYWINHASIYFIIDVHITHLLPPSTQSGAAAVNKSWRDVHVHIQYYEWRCISQHKK